MPLATGGTSTTQEVNSIGTKQVYNIHAFTTSGNLTVTQGGTFEYMVAAGGGGGGSDMGGGGGGGGFLTGNITLNPGTYTVTVGAGGTGATAGTDQPRAISGGSSAITPAGFKGHSYSFDGIGDGVNCGTQSAYAIGSGAFCLEGWIYNHVVKDYSTLWTTRPDNGSYGDAYHIGWSGVGGISLYVGSAAVVGGASGTIKAGQWQHIATCRNSSGNTAFFVDGVRVGYVASYTNNFTRSLLGLGDFPTTKVESINGYISNARIVVGNAVYDPTQTTYTVPTAPLTAISGTVILTAQDNSFIDNSANNFTLTAQGNSQTSHFTPFTGMAIGAAGGGGGASDHTGPAATSAAASGGSGGGAAGNNANRGIGITGQGSAGANSAGSWYPGGGGGAGGAGATNPANGGVGRESTILGTSYYWSGGGAGAGYTGISGNGGIGGGGGGAPKSTSGGGSPGAGTYAQGQVPYMLVGNHGTYGTLNAQTNVPGGPGIINSGGGGGGSAHFNTSNPGGNGGSGMVVIKYLASANASGSGGAGGPNAGGGGGAGNDGYLGRVVPSVITVFTSSGNLTVTGTGNVEYLVVGGGGGGGSDMGGGGGGGGYLAGFTTLSSGTYLVTVGAGGAGAPAGISQPPGSNGGDSAIQTYASGIGNNYSYYFDTYNDFISFPSNAAFDIGSNDACKELWFWMHKDDGTYHTFCGQNSSTGSTIRIGYNTGQLYYTINNDTGRGTTSVETQTWYHVVVTYTGGTAKFFVNGQLRDVATGLGSITARAETYFIGQEDSIWMDGYISNFRFCNGSIPTLYQTASTTIGAQIFTPPTASLTTTSQGATAAHVRLLTCQSSAVVDNSPNNFTPTKTGEVISVRFNPFERLTSVGGGGGASEYSNNNSPGRSGGSGGGVAGSSSTTQGRGIRPNLQGIPGQGFQGGTSGGSYYPGGGGGAGAAGSNSPGNGGNGVLNSILGVGYYWAAGGGGAGYSSNPGNGGLGGGGGGAPKQSSALGVAGTGGYQPGTDGTIGSLNSQTNVPGGRGGTNTGSGGGGGAHYNSNNNGGAGGSGIVILKYRPDQVTLSGGSLSLNLTTLDNIYGGGFGATGSSLAAGNRGSLFGGGGGGSGSAKGGGGGGISVIGVRDGLALGGTAGGTDGGNGQAGIFGEPGSNGNGGLYGGGGGGTTYSVLDPAVGNGARGALAIFWQGNILQYPTVIQANNVSAFGTPWALAPGGNIAQGYLLSNVTIESLEAGISGNTDTLLQLEVRSESRPTANSNLGILTDTIANANIRAVLSVNSVTATTPITAVNNIAVQELQIITYRTDDEMMLVTVQNTGGYTNSAQRIDRITEENDPRRVKAYLLNYIVGVTGEDNDIIQTQIWF